jgi:hypothetical protein
MGYSVSFFVRKSVDPIERWVMTAGFGLAAFAVLSIFLNLIRIQLHWIIFLVLSLIFPVYCIYRHVSKHGLKLYLSPKLRLSKSTVYAILAILIFIVFFSVYHKGAFTYPYLEDDDPWLHAVAAKYVAVHKTFSHDPSIQISYIEPYPPSYAILMGVLHQTNTDIIWNLKFFNVLILSLGVLFFFFFAKEFFGSSRKAIFATFIIAVIPCFMSHFIWASSLAIILFFPVLYAAERVRHDKNWWVLCAIGIAAILLSQPSNAAIFGIIFIIYWAVKAVTFKSFQKHLFLAGILGVFLAFSVFYLPMLFKYGWAGIGSGIGFGKSSLLHFTSAESGGGLLYTWADFIFARTASKMDNPVGVGFVLFFLLVLSVILLLYTLLRKPKQILSSDNFPSIFTFILLIFTFAGIHGNHLPIQLMPHRFWSIFAIPVALICVEGFFTLGRLFEKIRVHRVFIYGALIIGILFTSAYPKYVVETSYWPPGVNWGSMEEVQGYLSYVAPLPYNTRVFALCSDDFKVLAFDKFAEPWDPKYVSFKNSAINSTARSLSQGLKSMGYSYLVMDAYCVRKFSINETNDKLMEIGNSSYFEFAGGNRAFFMFKVL